MKITRSNDETARRLRDALQAEADTVQPADAWSTITDRLDRRPSPWAWITERPLLIGGAVVLVALLGFLAVTQLGGDDDETQVEFVDDPPTTEDPAPTPVDEAAGPVVAARADGSLALLDPATGEVVEEFGPPEATDPSQGLAVAADGSVYYAVADGPRRSIDCANDETSVDEFLWRGVPDGEAWLVSAPFPRGRMPMPTPDGSLLAFVSTSNGEMCDGALVVHVGDVATEAIVATHTLPVGVEPTQLLWGADDQLVITLPAGEDASGAPEVNLVSVDPLTSGPVSMGGEPLYGRYRIAPGAEQGYITVFVAEDGTATVATRSDPITDPISPPVGSVEIPGEGPRFPVALAEDGAGTIWVTLAEGEPDTEGYGESFTTWRIPVVDGEPGEPVQVSDEFVAVAATPFD